MNLPNCLFTFVLLTGLWPGSEVQLPESCAEIKVEMKIESEGPGSAGTSKVILNFESADYKNFKLFLFSGQESNNRLDFTATEIHALPRGNYTLVIKSEDEKFCPKELKFKIN